MTNLNPLRTYYKNNSFGQNNKNFKTQNLNNNETDIKLKYPFHYGKNILIDLPISISAYTSLKKDEKFLKALLVLSSIVFAGVNIGEIKIKEDNKNKENNLKKVKGMLALKQLTELSFSLLSAFFVKDLDKKNLSNKKAMKIGLGVLTSFGAIASIVNNAIAYNNYKKENNTQINENK